MTEVIDVVVDEQVSCCRDCPIVVMLCDDYYCPVIKNKTTRPYSGRLPGCPIFVIKKIEENE